MQPKEARVCLGSQYECAVCHGGGVKVSVAWGGRHVVHSQETEGSEY